MDWSNILSEAFLVRVLAAGIQSATPLVLAAQGEIFAERAGVLNLGVEGLMLLCGFIAFSVAFLSKSLGFGLLAALVAGAVLGLLFAFVTVTLRSDQIVAGLAFLILCSGAAYYLNRLQFGTTLLVPRVAPLAPAALPGLADIPLLGPILFQQNALTYLTFLAVPVAMGILYHTPFGLRVHAVGEFPAAADVVGVRVPAIRYLCVMVGGMMAGLAGGYLSLAVLGLYSDSMVGGRGFMALALVVFGRWDPLWTAAGGLLFGGVDAVQTRLQLLGAPVPAQFLIMLPYLLTVLILLVGRGRAAPAALTIPYSRE